MLEEYNDRRKNLRIPIVQEIKCRLGEFEPTHVLLIELSGGGARIISQDPIANGEEVRLTIPLNRRNVEIRGNIIWTREIRILRNMELCSEYMGGVRFDGTVRAVQDYISSCIDF